jgi:CBS domain-containing protein
MNEIKVSDVMTTLVVAFRPQDGIQEAARLLVANRISGAPVVEEGRLVGIVSEADIVSAYSGPAARGSPFVATDPLMFLLRGRVPRTSHRHTVDEVMTRQVISISPEARLREAAFLLDRYGVRRLPVVNDKGYLVGVVARADVVSAMARPDVPAMIGT